jgi:tetratricopeptide (TPR) repeat protein
MKMFAFAFVVSCASVVPALSQNNECNTVESCQAALKANLRSSLAHYRMGKILFQIQNASECRIERNALGAAQASGCENYRLAMNEFRAAISGDLQPKWIEVWAHINLGKVFDVMDQRDRALNEYRLARRTKDNTRGAQDEADKYTESPYTRPSN